MLSFILFFYFRRHLLYLISYSFDFYNNYSDGDVFYTLIFTNNEFYVGLSEVM